MTIPTGHADTESAVSHGTPAQTAGPRYHAFDALRGAAMSLGVVLHAAIAYMVVPLPGLAWPVHDEARSRIIDWLFWWIHGFRIPLFFVVAGFFSVMLYNSRGAKKYIDHRTHRILIPLLIAGAIILPITLAVWSYGWIDSGQYTWDQIRHQDFGSKENHDSVTGLAHLWFLEYLYIYCLAFWLWKVVMQRINPPWRRGERVNRFAQALFRNPLRPLFCAIPVFALLAFDNRIITYFQNEYLPPVPELLYHFSFFLIGTWMYTMCRSIDDLKRLGRTYLLLSIIIAVFMIMRIEHGLQDSGESTANDLGLAALVASFCWLSIFGWIGVSLRFFDGPHPAVRWLSDSAYWVYILHLPIVGLLHVWLSHVEAPALVKFAAVIVIAYGFCLVTYQLFVRHSFIGVMLNGRRERAGDRKPHEGPQESTSKARPVNEKSILKTTSR